MPRGAKIQPCCTSRAWAALRRALDTFPGFRLAVVPVMGLLGGSAGLAQGLPLHPTLAIRNAVINVQLGPELEPVACLRVGRVFRDYQTRGFLRIGVLPMAVLESLHIELRDADRLSTVLERVSENLAGQGNVRKAVEARDFRLSFAPSGKSGQLCARRVRLEQGAVWRLLDGVVERPGAAAVAFRQATLTVAGARAGELVCETAEGSVRLHLLVLRESKRKEL